MTSNPTPPNPASSTSAPAPAPVPAPAAPAPGAPKPVVAFDDFAKLDLRVARIVQAEAHPKADRLFKLQVDDGSGTPRQLCAGIREHYQADQLVGRLIIIVANLEPKVIRGEQSRGMLLAASNVPKDSAGPETVRRVVLLRPDVDIEPGAVVS
jgi:methionine--tRNA ligase beta chain